MNCSFRNKFLFCFPLLYGCFLIGAVCYLLGLFLLFYTFATLPVQRLEYLKTYYFLKFMFFLATLTVYYVGLMYAGMLTMYGVLKRKHTKLIPLLAALIAHPFMAISYNVVYTTDWNGNHYTSFMHTRTRTQFFEYNGAYIFIIGLIVAAYFALCIFNGVKMIESDQNGGKSMIFKFKFLEFSTFFGVMPLESGGYVIGATSSFLGLYYLYSLISTDPVVNLAIQDTLYLTMYYSSLSFNCFFFIALIMGGILIVRGVYKKNYKIMKPLMIILAIEPGMIYFFLQVYLTNNHSLNAIGVSTYIMLSLLSVYSAFCVINLQRLIRKESKMVDDNSFEKLNNYI